MKYTCILDSSRSQRIFESDKGDLYLVDHSGSNPEWTDDGPLRLNIAELLHRGLKALPADSDVGAPAWELPVNKERENDKLLQCRIDARGAIFLARRFDIPVEIITGGHRFVCVDTMPTGSAA